MGFACLCFAKPAFFEKQHPQSQNQAAVDSIVDEDWPLLRQKPGPGGTEGQAASVAKPAPSTQPRSSVMNVLSAENGGHVVVATNDRWPYAIDGDEKNWQYIDIGVLIGSWAVYGFKNDKPASFDTFKVLILGTETWNLKEFELLAGSDSATGKLGVGSASFRRRTSGFSKNPYQELRISPPP